MKPLPELTDFLEGLSEPHILFDAQYRIVMANAAYRRAFSPERSVIGRTCYEVSHHFQVPCDQAGESCPLAQARASGQRERVLHLHHTPKGEEYVNIELTPLRDASGEHAFFVEKMASLKVAHGLSVAQGLIGRSAVFQHMLALVARVAPSLATVLLLGESGTGKELVAQAVHDASPRATKPLVVVDCSSLPETLFESELFGHERGAFTGANTSKAGLVEAASGGTLFLDEVGDIPIALPPLRERREDIALLTQALLARVAPQRSLSVAPKALALLAEQPFPGNVRELRNLLERTTLMCDGDRIEVEHVAQALNSGRRSTWQVPTPYAPATSTQIGRGAPVVSAASLRELELSALRERVATHTGSRAELAAALGISERSLYRKLKTLGV